MIDHDWRDVVASLERMRARLEAALSDMNAPRERQLASNPVHEAWKSLGEAIDQLRSIEAGANGVERLEQGAFDTPDDLTSIRGISAEFADHLAVLGVTRYSAIAAWGPDEVHRVARALGLTREISRQNWIEQAALLERSKTNGGNESKLLRRSAAELPAMDAAAAVQKPDASAAAPVEEGGAVPALPSPLGARIPTISPSSPMSHDASGQMRQREQQAQPRTRNLDHAAAPPPGDAHEAAVMFVVREQAPSEPSAIAASATGNRPKLFDRARHPEGEETPAAYVANEKSAQEAEVVVVRPQIPNRPGAMERQEAGVMRRVLKALKGR